MKTIAKKTIIYSMVGIMQIGLVATVAEAATINNGSPSRVVLLDSHHDRDRDGDKDRDHDRDRERQREHDRRMKAEKERHDREMRRHHGEGEREWHERQERERERHDREMREIAALLIGVAIGKASND